MRRKSQSRDDLLNERIEKGAPAEAEAPLICSGGRYLEMRRSEIDVAIFW